MKIFPVTVSVFFAAMLIVSCKSVDAASSATKAPQKAEKPAPKTVEIRTWKIESVKSLYPDGMVSSVSTTKYDDSGKILSEAQYDGKNNLVSEKEYAWNSDKSVTMVSKNAAGEVIGKMIGEYDGPRLMKETLANEKDDVQSTESYRYDAAGNRTGLTVTTATGGTVSTDYVRENGILVRIRILDASGNVIKRFERTYDALGALLKEDEYDADGTLRGSIAYTLDKGVIVREDKLNAAGGVIGHVEYVNDENGNAKEVRYFAGNGKLVEMKQQQWKLFTRTEIQQ
jgi:YD repeat-containing protein